jgi:glycine/D-amino acid oxidase-like deaminating enzyme
MTIPEKLANRDLDASILAALDEPPDRARVLIVGGGVIGSSIAYHLTRLDLSDVVVLERGRLTSGTSWHAQASSRRFAASRTRSRSSAA